MYHRLVLHFIQRFSYLQQYLIILFFSLILLLIFKQWWCILLLPFSTILVNFTIKRLSRTNQSPLKFSGYLYKLLLRKRAVDQNEQEIDFYQASIEKECDTYVKTIIQRYIAIWYYPLISTDQEFIFELVIIFNMIRNRLNDRLKSLNTHDLIRSIIDLKQKHLEQYLHTHDSYRKQRKQNRMSKFVVEEFSHIIGFHNSLVKNDIHAYFKGVVELFLTELLPETLHIYSFSRPSRELITQLLVNCVFLPLFKEFSKPRMIYYLLVVLLESDEEKKAMETTDNSSITQSEMMDIQNERESVTLADDFNDQSNRIHHPRPSRLERIINSAMIISFDTAYNSMSGAAYIVYMIQCETKSPYTSDATQQYTIRRRFREFMNLHKRLQQNHMTSQHCQESDEVFRALPLGVDNMNTDIIRRRKCILEQYIQQVIANDVLNCSHDVLEFFAFNSDPNKQFEPSPPSKLPVPRVDKVLFRTLSDVGTKLNNLLPNKRELTPLRETFQLNISAVYEPTSYPMKQLVQFIKNRSSLQSKTNSSGLNTTDLEFLQLLLARSSIVTSRRKEKNQSDIPLTDAVLNLIYTCLHSREAIISTESVYQIIRTILGHFIEEFLKNEIDGIFSAEKILTYLIELRTKVLWSGDDNPSPPMRNVKHRAFNAFVSKIPMWIQHIVGVENIHRMITNLLHCLSYEELNQHFLLNTFDLLIEQLIPNIATQDFLTKYVQMHAGLRG